METKSDKVVVPYGISHTKFYKPSVVSPFLEEVDDKNRLLRRHSDIYLVLRQDNLVKSIGVEAVRSYIASMAQSGDVPPIPSDMSDDDLFELIEPKEIDNITDAWKFGQYLKSKKEKLVDDYKKLHKHYSRYQKYLKSSDGFSNSNKSD